jgi:diguanylate cyclase (GGDEF)-like protein
MARKDVGAARAETEHRCSNWGTVGKNSHVHAPGTPSDESRRLAELRALDLLDSESEERFDRVTRLAQRLFDVPIALVSLIDADRQWFKSRQGLGVAETPRDISFCGHAILGDEVLHIPDAAADVRFADNPLVTGDPSIRFYAGYPIAGPGGSKLGTLCVIGREPRQLSEEDEQTLRDLGQMVEREIAAAHLAFSDELTGLSNRRGFETLGAKVLNLCRRRGIAATLLYIDLTGFKAINDDHGHVAGDRALQEFARILERTFRESDLIARLGGDEFAVLLSGADDPVTACARLEHELAERNRASDGFALRGDVGVAAFDPAAEETLADLVARADANMYAQKHSSR